MAEVKWIKLKTNMFDDEKIQLIDAMPERDTILYVWIRLLVQAGKTNADGYIYLSETVPYTDEMLSTLFRRPINTVRLALETLKRYGMIDISEDHYIKVVNWSKHQNAARLDELKEYNKLAKQKERERKKLNSDSENVNDSQGKSIDCQDTDKEREKELEKDIDIEEDKERETLSLNPKTIELCKYYSELKPGQSIMAQVDSIKIMIEMYGFDWCKEALQKTVSNKGKYIQGYMEAILKNWQKDGKNDNSQGKYKTGDDGFKAPRTTFNSYDQRTYDVKKLENKLLGRDEGDEDG